jgi:hypothetical protein
VREPLQLACPSTSQRDHRAEPTEQCASEHPSEKGVINLALHGTFVPGQAVNLATIVGLSAGFSWSVFEK